MNAVRFAARLALVTVAFVLTGTTSDHFMKAKARITSCADGSPVGSALLVERPSSEGVKLVDVFVNARGLSRGKHAVHIHAVGDCTPCSDAGSHLDLGPFAHNTPVTENHPYHSGDLVNLEIGSRGRGTLITTTSHIALSPDPPERLPGRNLSIFDEDGSSIIIHALPDLYCPDPTDAGCAGGARAACGIFEVDD